MRQTPPRPCRSFRSSVGVYSRRPYGGSVTTAWMDCGAARANQSKATAKLFSTGDYEFLKVSGLGRGS